MSLVIIAFTWIGAITCLCGALLMVFWIVDFTARRFLRELRWWEAFVRFLWLDGNKKSAFRDESEEALLGKRQ